MDKGPLYRRGKAQAWTSSETVTVVLSVSTTVSLSLLFAGCFPTGRERVDTTYDSCVRIFPVWLGARLYACIDLAKCPF